VSLFAIFSVIAIILVALLVYKRQQSTDKPVSTRLRRGQPLPEFAATDENGEPVHTQDLRGSAIVMLFVRGNWCPFCSSQVEDLILHYKAIDELGARLILVTPKPLQTTRRVADFFEVDFDFWLDANLVIGRQLGLVHKSGVPGDYHREYGEDTYWPMALVIDATGVIRFAEKSRQLSDRPDPKLLLDELRAAIEL
jgi:peroxiredoxin